MRAVPASVDALRRLLGRRRGSAGLVVAPRPERA
jgi:hypothetical protein